MARQRQGSNRPWLILAAVVVVIGLAVWALLRLNPTPSRVDQVAYAPVTGSLTFPSEVLEASPDLRSLYEFAARRPDVLNYLPCFCGCGWTHKSNYECFIDEVRPDGTVVIDDMSFT
jgi:hypothetical protein